MPFIRDQQLEESLTRNRHARGQIVGTHRRIDAPTGTPTEGPGS